MVLTLKKHFQKVNTNIKNSKDKEKKMKEITKFILEDGDTEIIRNLETTSFCDRKGCHTLGCCGCVEQKDWEKSVAQYRNTPYWDLAKKYNEYKDLRTEVERLQLSLYNSRKKLESLEVELIELEIL